MILAREFGEDPVRAGWSYDEYRDRLQLLSEERLGKHIRSQGRKQSADLNALRSAAR